MEIVDANVVLRYLLKDHKQQFKKASSILEQREIFLPVEVTAEIVYVLEKVYEISAVQIEKALITLFDYPNIMLSDSVVMNKALHMYRTRHIDYVDAVLVAYNHVHGHRIHTFDKKLNKLCKK